MENGGPWLMLLGGGCTLVVEVDARCVTTVTVGGYKAQIRTQTARHKKHASFGHREIETQSSFDSLITKINHCVHLQW